MYDILDIEGARQKFEDILDSVPPEELDAWKAHSCTKALVWGVIYNEMSVMDNLCRGDYTAESAEGTAQLNAQAIGHLKALKEVKRLISQEIINSD